MRKGMRVLVVLAAALSVVAIPFIALVGNKHSDAWTATATGVASVATAVAAFAFSSITYWKSSKIQAASEEKSVEMRSILEHNVIALAEGPVDIQLLREFSAIEREAQNLLGGGSNISVIRLRSRLLELGIWSERDVYDFDVALRTRNQVAHGEQADVTRASMSQAIDTIRRLRQKVEASQLRER